MTAFQKKILVILVILAVLSPLGIIPAGKIQGRGRLGRVVHGDHSRSWSASCLKN